MDTKERRRPAGRYSASGKRQAPRKSGRPAPAGRASNNPSRRSAVARKSAQHSRERRAQAAKRRNAPAVVYTQPQPFNPRRLIFQLAIVLAVVVAIVLGMSVFFRVKNVVVYGNNAYSAWAVRNASGIEDGENLLALGNTKACAKVKAELSYVDKVRIGITLPDTVNIYITEYDVVYAIQATDGSWWLMTYDGRIAEQTDSGGAAQYTKIEGVKLADPVVGEQAAVAQNVVPSETGPTEASEATTATTPSVTDQNRLDAALTVLAALDANEVVGKAASINVASVTDIVLWYGQQYRVELGDTSEMDKKIRWMAGFVDQNEEYQMGVLDITFTTWEDQIVYTPFE